MVTNAPGRSAYNRVERRRAPLSKQLSGLILQHDMHGTHLDSRGKTIDSELEFKNFESAGQTLAEIWNELIIDDHPVIAEYKNFMNIDDKLENCDSTWYANHVRESQYFLQIVKCKNIECCSEFMSDIRSVLADRFFHRLIQLLLKMEGCKYLNRIH